jgi:hypothetical protein
MPMHDAPVAGRSVGQGLADLEHLGDVRTAPGGIAARAEQVDVLLTERDG